MTRAEWFRFFEMPGKYIGKYIIIFYYYIILLYVPALVGHASLTKIIVSENDAATQAKGIMAKPSNKIMTRKNAG